jgi:hypothetical protein
MMTDACTLTAQHTVLGTPIGDLTVVREGDLLTGLYFPHHWYKPDPVTFGPRNDRGFEGVAGQLEEYLAGSRTLFDLPLERFWMWSMDLCGITVIEFRAGRAVLRAHNLTAHLAALTDEKALADLEERSRSGAL